jgi:hypothetical protein
MVCEFKDLELWYLENIVNGILKILLMGKSMVTVLVNYQSNGLIVIPKN